MIPLSGPKCQKEESINTERKTMIPIDQTLFNTTGVQGNCMQAAVASLLELPLSEVPHFAESGIAEVCWGLFEDFLEKRGYTTIITMKVGQFVHPYLASGSTVRHTKHMVVMQEGQLLHDPHPSRAGLYDIDCLHFVVKANDPLSQP